MKLVPKHTVLEQYGGTTIVRYYEKKPILDRTKITRKKKKQLHLKRFKSQINKTKASFFKIVSEAVYQSQTVHFLTLTYHKDAIVNRQQAGRHLAHFIQNYRRIHEKNLAKDEVRMSFIGVPEYTKEGQIHFHILMFNNRVFPQMERSNRSLQHCWKRGFVDLRNVTKKNPQRLAGYLTKYLGKDLSITTTAQKRSYFASRNIPRPRRASTDTLSEQELQDFFIPQDTTCDVYEYQIKYWG